MLASGADVVGVIIHPAPSRSVRCLPDARFGFGSDLDFYSKADFLAEQFQPLTALKMAGGSEYWRTRWRLGCALDIVHDHDFVRVTKSGDDETQGRHGDSGASGSGSGSGSGVRT